MTYIDPRMADLQYRARTWEHLAACVAKGEAAAREQQQQILEESPREGDTVRLSPFLTGVVTEIRCNGLEMPMALVVSQQPTGKGGEVASRSEWVALQGLRVVEQPALQQAPESLQLPEATADLFDAGINNPESGSSDSNT
jgi:hypothetical protein